MYVYLTNKVSSILSSQKRVYKQKNKHIIIKSIHSSFCSKFKIYCLIIINIKLIIHN